jgi:hypothetical protein
MSSTVYLSDLARMIQGGNAPHAREAIAAFVGGRLWSVSPDRFESYLCVADDAAEAMHDGEYFHEVKANDRWTADRVTTMRGELFGWCPLEVVPAGDAARVTLELPRPTDEEAEGLPRIGGSYDLTALDAAVAGALGLSAADLANPAATNILDGGMLWSWEAVV